MDLRLLWLGTYPYVLGFIGLGLGCLVGFADSPWIWAFTVPPIIAGWVRVFHIA